jgi:hypothetical protein
MLPLFLFLFSFANHVGSMSVVQAAAAATVVGSALGQLSVQPQQDGRRYVVLPTGQQACRRLMQSLCINVRFLSFLCSYLRLTLRTA